MDLSLPSKNKTKQQQQKQPGSSLSQSLWPKKWSTVIDSLCRAGGDLSSKRRGEGLWIQGSHYVARESNPSLTRGSGVEALGVPLKQ